MVATFWPSARADSGAVSARSAARISRPPLGPAGFHDVGQGPGSSEGRYIDWLTISDNAQSVVEDVTRIRSHPLVPGRIPVYGYIYDVVTGRLVEVPDATKAGLPN